MPRENEKAIAGSTNRRRVVFRLIGKLGDRKNMNKFYKNNVAPSNEPQHILVFLKAMEVELISIAF